MLAFTRRLIRLRLEHPVFRRRRFLTGVEATELRWYTPAGTEMTNADWANTGAHSVAVYLDGADDPDRAADGTPLLDDDFLVLVNAWWEPLDFAVASTPAPAWRPEIDTYERSGLPAAANVQAGETVTVRPRSIVVLCGSRN